jgi:hypothetical protein
MLVASAPYPLYTSKSNGRKWKGQLTSSTRKELLSSSGMKNVVVLGIYAVEAARYHVDLNAPAFYVAPAPSQASVDQILRSARQTAFGLPCTSGTNPARSR